MKKYLFVLVFTLLLQSNYCQEDSTKIELNNDYQVELLSQQNKQLRNFHDTLTNSLHWSLGFAATFLILFLGINIYFLKTRYNEDKENILKHIEDTINLKIIEHEKIFSDKMIEFHKEWENIHGNLENISKKVFNKNIQNIKINLSTLNKNIINKEIDIYENKIDLLKINAPKETILRTIFDQTRSLKRSNDYLLWGWKISLNLGEMENLITEGAKFDSTDLPDVTKLLNSLPEDFNDAVLRLRTKIQSCV